MPFPLLKLYWAGKILKYPFVAIVQTVREYRRRETIAPPARAEPLHGESDGFPVGRWRRRRARRSRFEIHERGFFHHPIRALFDRRFWIRGVTNSSEMLLQIVALWAWLRNASCRKMFNSFVVWNPLRGHESGLFAEVEFRRWGGVLKRCATWIGEGFRLWYGPPAPLIAVRPHGRHEHWRDVQFDGADVAVYVGPKPWRRGLREYRRRGGDKILRVQWIGPQRIRATLLDQAGEVIQTCALGPS